MLRPMMLLIALLAACTPGAPLAGDGHPPPSTAERQGARDSEPASSADHGSKVPGEAASEAVPPPVDETELDAFFLSQMKTVDVPGVSVAVTRNGKLKWAKGY